MSKKGKRRSVDAGDAATTTLPPRMKAYDMGHIGVNKDRAGRFLGFIDEHTKHLSLRAKAILTGERRS